MLIMFINFTNLINAWNAWNILKNVGVLFVGLLYFIHLIIIIFIGNGGCVCGGKGVCKIIRWLFM